MRLLSRLSELLRRFNRILGKRALLLILCLTLRTLHAQTFRGSLTGTITDPSGAAIPAVDVILTETDKQYIFTGVSDANGRYNIRDLAPGNYHLKVRRNGFEMYNLDNIAIGINQNASIDVALKVGSVIDTVAATSVTPLLDIEDVSLGGTIDRRLLNDLPLVGRSAIQLVYIVPGVTQAQGQTLSSTGDTAGNALNFVSDGQRNATAAMYVDGVVVSQGDPNPGVVRPLYVPTVDSVQEFSVQQGIFRADMGFSGGTVVNVVTRSGSDSVQGTLYDFYQNAFLNSNDFFNRLNDVGKPPANNNIFGGVLGGPIYKNRTFFFVVYDGSNSRNSKSTSSGVPDALERAGNFAELCTAGFDSTGQCNSPAQQLWDPYTAIQSSSGPVSQYFIPYNDMAAYVSPGLPASEKSPITLSGGRGNLIDPVASRIMHLAFPAPNVNIGTGSYDRYNNYFTTTHGSASSHEFDVRIDQRFTDKDNLIGKVAYEWIYSDAPGCFSGLYDPCSNGPGTGRTYQVALNYFRAISSKTLFQLQGGIINNIGISKGIAAQYPAYDAVNTLGMPGYIESAGYKAVPYITYGGYSLGQVGGKPYQIYNIQFQTWQVGGSVEALRGRHDMKVGGDFRLARQNYYQPGVPAGEFNFTTAGSSHYGNGNGGGDSLASLLIGGPLNGADDYQMSTAINSLNPTYDLYIQDTWHATPRLTVDVGLRYEIQVPETESSNRIAWFDPNVVSPVAAIPGFGNLKGAVVFAMSSAGPRGPIDTHYRDFGPRIGLVCKINDNTTVRSGYGIFYLNSIATASGVTSGNSSPWEQYTSAQSYAYNGDPVHDGATPYSRLTNPFPGGVLVPVGYNPSPLAFAGLSVLAPIRTVSTIPYQQTWTLGLQRDLPGQTLLNLYYVGTRGVHLYDATAGNLNHLPNSVESLTPAERGVLANQYLSNPFYNSSITLPQGCSGYNLFCYPTISAVQLGLRYPQFSGVATTDTPFGFSIYHALQVQATRRYNNGLQAQLAYTWSKSIDNSSVASGGSAYLAGYCCGVAGAADPNNLNLEKAVSGFDVPQNLTFAYTYDLPWGRNRRFGARANPVLQSILGRWKVAGMHAYQSGFPLSLYQSSGSPIPSYQTIRPTLSGVLRKSGSWNSKHAQAGLNEYFANPSVAIATPSYTLGNAPRFTSSVRAPGINTVSIGIYKEFPMPLIRDGARYELRIESFNVFNHPQFGAPATAVDTGNFGQVTSQVNSPRQIQLGGKLYF